MQTAKIIFASNYKPFSLLIMLGTVSRWSHCGVVDGDYIIDTTLSSGVRRVTFDEWKTHYSYYEVVDIPVKDLESALVWARSQVGKSYDPLGILSFIIRKDYEEKDKWFCSEFVSKFIGIKNKVWRLSPQYLKQLSYVVKGWLI